jgi:hypothetical protein
MRLCITTALSALFLLSPSAVARQNPTDDSVVHGTINVALGNRNGLVVLTDSMITAGGHQLPNPGQKLFKLDDHTVCSFAGFSSAAAISAPGSSPKAAVPDLNTSASAIIHQYVRQSAGQSQQSIAERLRAISFLMGRHLSAIANVRDALGNPTPIDGYRFQLIVAGYDVDEKPKIGRITLRMKDDRGSFVSEVEEAAITIVEDKIVWQLNGMPDVAIQLLQHPESKSRDAALAQYAASLKADGGKSLSIEQMVALAKSLAYYTSQAHPEVGGVNQVAILQKSQSVSIEQPAFPEPPRPLVGFSLVVNSEFSYAGVAFAPPAVFVRCSWTGMERDLDGNFYIGNKFTKSHLLYDGGAVNLGETNEVVDSVLLLGPHVKLGDETARRLAKEFSWSQILRAVPKPAP